MALSLEQAVLRASAFTAREYLLRLPLLGDWQAFGGVRIPHAWTLDWRLRCSRCAEWTVARMAVATLSEFTLQLGAGKLACATCGGPLTSRTSGLIIATP